MSSSSARPSRPDPLIDIVLRPTATDGPGPGSSRYAAERRRTDPGRPVRSDNRPVLGTDRSEPARSRAAVVMARSRSAILDGARQAVLRHGTAITMAEVAEFAGVAKATLYNHFRTREEVLAALLLEEIDRLVQRVEHRGLADGLTVTATTIATHPLLERLGQDETLTLVVLAQVDVLAPGWRRVAQAVERALDRAGRQGTPTVLRWLSSLVIEPADDEDIAADIAVLLAGLPASVRGPMRQTGA